MSEHTGTTMETSKRPNEEGLEDRSPKRVKNDDSAPVQQQFTNLPTDVPAVVSRLGLKPLLPVMPPSLDLITGKKTDLSERKGFIGEREVGIIGYVGDSSFTGVQGVIKQRFTDFLVNEISTSGQVLHLLDIGLPTEPETPAESAPPSEAAPAAAPSVTEPPTDSSAIESLPEALSFSEHADWPVSTTVGLREHFSDDTVIALRQLFDEGRTPPPRQDSGWGSRDKQRAEQVNEEEAAMNVVEDRRPAQGRGRGNGRGRGPSGGNPFKARDTREVVTQVIEDKAARGAAHQAVRDLLKGAFESTVRVVDGQGQCLVLKWAASRSGGRDRRPVRKNRLPQYIHFTLQKTNRETQDCLGHISRMLNVHTRDLAVCGTKDKRAITVQRVSLKRGGLTTQQVWRAVNGVKAGRRTEEGAVLERGERGTRIGDLEYAPKPLELGSLKGNEFVITLRNVQADVGDIDRAMESIRDKGFINFFGMQRFGTSTVPTHVTGLLLLQGKWGEAIDSILSLREGEHPDCTRGRLAWLEDGDFKKALQHMPRRAVAERSIWEHWSRGNRVEDKVGALGNIPRNLRTMYVHAYQSYIWNLMAAKRIKMSSDSALEGDLVYVSDPDEEEDAENKETSSRNVKRLTAEEAKNYTLADVILPMPGWNIEYPGGSIGKLYQEALIADGLDPQRLRRDQREYSLPGSYRRIVRKPTNVSWEHIRYTDPTLPLVQADEDRILGLNPSVADDPEGKFRALKITWSLGTASYATMALRELTREETATWHQIGLTLSNEDQAHIRVTDKEEGSAA